jgi:hypothetical protein
MKNDIFHNNVFMAILSIIIIVAIVFMVTNSGHMDVSDKQADSAGNAYSPYTINEDIFAYQNEWTYRPITTNNRMPPLPEQYNN